MPAVTPEQLRQYHEEGYVVLRGAFSKQRVASLVDGINRVMDAAIAGKCQIGWFDQAKRLPSRTSHLLHPDKYQPAFGEWLAEELDPQIEALIGGQARHSLFGMLAGGNGSPYLQGWHRDLGKPGAPDELEYLKHHHGRFVQFNAPIQPDDHFLNIVPRSHLRVSTPAEIKAMSRAGFQRADPSCPPNTPLTPDEIKALDAWDKTDAMPDAMVVRMEPGDIAYYNANLWHRGWNPLGKLRWTMHSAFWLPRYEVMAHEHGQRDAMLTPGHMDRMPARARAQIQRYLDAYPAGKPKTLMEV